ncbi:ricin-type beta-trefoil lectin domain protein [Streptomyces liangshanensis]|uniref:ricin-type beta-trefoil lectin domain protein n=1 Tax=Streptomyces liangshanensis TaxID=2717324 RepID=UPI0036DB967D
MFTTREQIGRTRFGVIAAVAFTLALFGMLVPGLTPPAAAAPTAALPACQFWSDVVPPVRPVSPWIPPLQTSPAVNFTQRLPAPTGVTGSLVGGRVAVTFNRVPGAQSYRLWRNGQPIAWLLGFDQPTITITDTAPCENAYYNVIALSDQSATDPSTGRLSAPYQLNSSGVVVPWTTPAGRTIDMKVTAYNDTGTTASGYKAQLGVCAVDPRVIPWGTYFTVPGYGTCYAADIGTWIQNNTVDVWLPPGTQADNWGVQNRTVTIIADPYAGTPPTGDPNPPTGGTGRITGLGGKCVDVAAASSANGTAVQLYDCNGSTAQRWTVASDGSLRALGKCLDLTAAGTANGTKAQLYDCNGSGAQKWQKGTGNTLVNPASGKCLDVVDRSTANGARLQIWTCAGGTNQQFTLPV